MDENGETVEDMLGEDGSEEADESADDGEKADEKKETVIFYVTDEVQQGQYIAMFKKAKMNAVILKHNIDTPFMQQLEMKNEGVKFRRIDADVTDAMKAKESKKDTERYENAAKDILKVLKKALKRDKLEVKVQKLKNRKVASMLNISEESRRMQDMMKMYSMGGDTGDLFKNDEGETLILNAGHPLVEKVMEKPEDDNAKLILEQLYYLAVIQNKQLSPEAMAKFIEHSNECLLKL